MSSSGIKLKTFPAVTVETAGTAVPVTDTPILVYSATIQSESSNTGLGYVGDETVDSTNGGELKPGGVCEIEPPDRAKATDQFDLSEIYIDASANDTVFRVAAWIRE